MDKDIYYFQLAHHYRALGISQRPQRSRTSRIHGTSDATQVRPDFDSPGCISTTMKLSRRAQALLGVPVKCMTKQKPREIPSLGPGASEDNRTNESAQSESSLGETLI